MLPFSTSYRPYILIAVDFVGEAIQKKYKETITPSKTSSLPSAASTPFH